MSLELVETRKRLQEEGYTKQWTRMSFPPQAQHVMPIKWMLERGVKSVVDVGCGDGALLAICKKAGMKTMGVELAEGGVQQAKERYDVDAIQFDCDQPDLTMPFEDDEFDCSMCVGPPESVFEMRPFLDEMVRIGKRTIIVAPNFAFFALRWGFLRKGRHCGRTDPNVAYNFVTRNWINYHIKRTDAKLVRTGATYPHDKKSGIWRESSPVSTAFEYMWDDPHAPLPKEYLKAEKRWSKRPELWARFFLFELVGNPTAKTGKYKHSDAAQADRPTVEVSTSGGSPAAAPATA